MRYPEIRFRDSFLLIGAIYEDIKYAYLPPLANKDETDLLRRDVIYKKLSAYETAWRPYEKELLHGMCDILGLEFRPNVIDIYGAPFYTSFSFPMIIATKYEPDRAIEVIAHELIHVLLYDNTSTSLDFSQKEEQWQKLFGVDDPVALVHIPVHAVLQYLFDEALKAPERTNRDKNTYANNPSYATAWEYVDKVGYRTVIEQLRNNKG